MKKYKVEFSGFAYVMAESKEEAKELVGSDEVVYEQRHIGNIERVESFTGDTLKDL